MKNKKVIAETERVREIMLKSELLNEQALTGRMCDIAFCSNGGNALSNFCAPPHQLPSGQMGQYATVGVGSVFTITQTYGTSLPGKTVFVRSVGQTCHPVFPDGTQTQITGHNNQACPACCDDWSGGPYNFVQSGWCWQAGAGPPQFPCGVTPPTGPYGCGVPSLNSGQCYNCVNFSTQYQLSNCPHSSMTDCQADPNCSGQPSESWDCDGQGNCSDPGTGNGQYTSLNDCNSNCVAPAYRCHDCDTPCTPNQVAGGHCPYNDSASCHDNCEETNKWRCYRDKFGKKKCTPCKVYQMTDGTMCFNTKQECLASSDCGERRLDDDRVHTRDDSNQDNPLLDPSSELTQNRKINESDLRRIIRKVIKS